MSKPRPNFIKAYFVLLVLSLKKLICDPLPIFMKRGASLTVISDVIVTNSMYFRDSSPSLSSKSKLREEIIRQDNIKKRNK